MVICIIVAIVAILLVYFFVTYNALIQYRNIVDESYATMDVYLVKRSDLIPNIVATVKGYAKHEAETLEAVTAQRTSVVASSDTNAMVHAENKVSTALRNLFAVAESYPDLKANTNFVELQKQLEHVEEDIANARKYYNGSVRQYNTKLQKFPSNIVAATAGFQKAYLFVADTPSARDNVKVEF